ncbi:MAG TPA: KH domain-containing protein [Acidimicrobiia bacterium]|nr:KH domain-containing protein [Acidimicrobiia bacterium]
MSRSDITQRVVGYVVSQIVSQPEAVRLDVVDQGPEDVVVEVTTARGDMGRVIGRRGRVARAIRTLAQAAADEEGLQAGVEFLDE